MPVYKVSGGYRWGKSGKVYKTRREAELRGKSQSVKRSTRSKLYTGVKR